MALVKVLHLVALILFFSHVVSGQSHSVLQQYSTSEGLSDNVVRCAVQDNQGFLWFGTKGGLNRFDGYSFKKYLDNPNDSTTLSRNISDMVLDDQGYLWIGSWGGGLLRFDPITESVQRFSSNTNALPNDFATTILYDAPNTLWIGHGAEGGLSRFDLETKEILNFQFEPDSVQGSLNNINGIHKDDRGRMWVGTHNGLYLYDAISNHFNRYTVDHLYSEKPIPYPNIITTIDDFAPNKLLVSAWYGPLVFDIQTEEFTKLMVPGDHFYGSYNHIVKGRESFWVANPNGGIDRFDTHDQSVHLDHRDLGVNERLTKRISPLIIDSSNTLWLGSLREGIITINSQPAKFHTFRLSSLEDNLSDNIESIFRDNQDNWWVGTEDGVFKFQLDSRTNKPISYDHFLAGFDVKSIDQDRNQRIWIGTQPGGLFRYDPETNSIDSYLPDNQDTNNHWIVEVYLDRDDRIWLGMGTNCLVEFIPDTEEFIYYECSNKIAGVNCILEDSFGTLWIGSIGNGGLMAFDRSAGEFVSFDINNIPNSPAFITSLFEDENGILWIVEQSGLYSLKLDYLDSLKKGNTKFVNHSSLVPVSTVSQIQGYGKHIWISSGSGLIKLDKELEKVTSYADSRGIQKRFNQFASFKDDSGILYFGGPDGLIFFHTDSINASNFIPPVVLTDFQISNRSISVNDSISGSVILTQVINRTDEISLPYGENFSLEFSALDFTNVDENLYTYKMEGVDQDWSPPSHNRTATYTKLWEGKYVFGVKGSNHDGVWNEEVTTITINVIPPIWRSWWAYLIYATILIAVTWSVFHFFITRERLKSKLTLEKLEVEKIKEIDQLKTRFFANVSHEFRTPLTLILGPIKQMYEGTFKGDTDVVLGVIIRNSKRLLHLVNQLLDFSKLEADSMPLQASIGDLVEFTRMMFANFESMAVNRKIHYVFQSKVSALPAYFDKEKLEKVIINLLDNAFKFTPNGGSIYLKLSRQHSEIYGEGLAEIRIEDDGKGISEEKLPLIFERFYQVNDTFTKEQEGTGIGLALAKELVELHQGSIFAQSTINQGTSIIVQLPLGRDHLSNTQIMSGRGYQRSMEIMTEETIPARPKSDLVKNDSEDLPLLLIIDDNLDMLFYIQEILGETYQLIVSQNGILGWENALEHTPDLIISDVMMPGMDGHVLCEKLKTDERTSHIPVILLTARAGETAKLEGLETGADDYITKPFSPAELRARVHNLIELREKLRVQYDKNFNLVPKDISLNSADERFLQRALDILEIHHSDSDFNSEDFAREIGMSRSQLHRKLKVLTSQPTGDFIRSYRLNLARELIAKNYADIAQISYECGFNSPSYFTSCFKKTFGITPSEYQLQAQ